MDFNNCFLIWDLVEQQSVGDLIDSLTGGIVGSLPELWVCEPHTENWHFKLEQKYQNPHENEKLFQKWCKEIRTDGGGFNNSIDFLYWLEEVKKSC